MIKNMLSGKNILLAIKTVVALLFIIMLIRLYSGIQNTYNALGWPEESLMINTLQDSRIFKPYILTVIILLMPLIGVFIKNKIGWLLVVSYFYFAFFSLVFQFTSEYLTEPIFAILMILIFLIILGIIVLMNLKSIRSSIYKIPNSQQIIYNIIATIIGLILTVSVAIIHN